MTKLIRSFRNYGIGRLKKSFNSFIVNINSDIAKKLHFSNNQYLNDLDIINYCLSMNEYVRYSGVYVFDFQKYPYYKILSSLRIGDDIFGIEIITIELEKGVLTPIYVKVLNPSFGLKHVELYYDSFCCYFVVDGMNKLYNSLFNNTDESVASSILHSALNSISYCIDGHNRFSSIEYMGKFCPDINVDVMSYLLNSVLSIITFIEPYSSDLFVNETENMLYPSKNGLNFIETLYSKINRDMNTDRLFISKKCNIHLNDLNTYNENHTINISNKYIFNTVTDIMNFPFDYFDVEFDFNKSDSLKINNFGSSSWIFINGINKEIINRMFGLLIENLIINFDINGFKFDIRNLLMKDIFLYTNNEKIKVNSIRIIRYQNEELFIIVNTKKKQFKFYIDLISLSILNPKIYYDDEKIKQEKTKTDDYFK